MEGDYQQSGRKRTTETHDHAICGSSAASRRMAYLTEPATFVSAGMGHGQGIAERVRVRELDMAGRCRLASVVVTDPGAGLPPGYLEHNKAGAKMMAAMGYKVGMGLGKYQDGIRMPLALPRRAWLGSIQDPMPSSATDNLPNP